MPPPPGAAAGAAGAADARWHPLPSSTPTPLKLARFGGCVRVGEGVRLCSSDAPRPRTHHPSTHARTISTSTGLRGRGDGPVRANRLSPLLRETHTRARRCCARPTRATDSPASGGRVRRYFLFAFLACVHVAASASADEHPFRLTHASPPRPAPVPMLHAAAAVVAPRRYLAVAPMPSPPQQQPRAASSSAPSTSKPALMALPAFELGHGRRAATAGGAAGGEEGTRKGKEKRAGGAGAYTAASAAAWKHPEKPKRRHVTFAVGSVDVLRLPCRLQPTHGTRPSANRTRTNCTGGFHRTRAVPGSAGVVLGWHEAGAGAVLG